MDYAKYRRILDENLLESAMNLKLDQRFTFQQANDQQNEKHGYVLWRTKRKKQS